MTTGDAFAMLRQMSKQPWTNDPTAPQYSEHWNTLRPADDAVTNVIPSVARGDRLIPPEADGERRLYG
jgi:hypothetical protein